MPVPTPARIPFDRVADRYDDTRGGLDRGRRQAERIAPWVVAGRPLLEVGIGTGLVAVGVREGGATVLGVDLSLPMLTRARARLGPVVVAGDALRLPVRDGGVGTVCFVHVLHLVTELDAALGEARRVLAHGGRVVALLAAEVPPVTDLGRVIDELHTTLRGERPDRPALVRAAAGRTGLRVEHEETLHGPHPLSPREAADRLEQRLLSWTWQLDDAAWAAHGQPAVQRLRALPDPDVARSEDDARTALVLNRG